MSHKGSKRCILEFISSPDFILKTNKLIDPYANISFNDKWIPLGVTEPKEGQIYSFLKPINKELAKQAKNWWIEYGSQTPHWDLISTCTINGKQGILLVEAKAHLGELDGERKGKPFDFKKATKKSVANHEKIKKAIEQTNNEINNKITPDSISISRDNCYQLSNRIAHAWWLANQGIPVILMYLGFLNCVEMKDGNRTLFTEDKDWQVCFKEHANQVGVDSIIDEWLDCGESKFITICRSYKNN